MGDKKHKLFQQLGNKKKVSKENDFKLKVLLQIMKIQLTCSLHHTVYLDVQSVCLMHG